jgi:hypothetical protein
MIKLQLTIDPRVLTIVRVNRDDEKETWLGHIMWNGLRPRIVLYTDQMVSIDVEEVESILQQYCEYRDRTKT